VSRPETATAERSRSEPAAEAEASDGGPPGSEWKNGRARVLVSYLSVMTNQEKSSHDVQLQCLTGIWQELARVERALTAAGRAGRHRELHSLPQVVARLGSAVRSHISTLELSPESDWAKVASDLAAAEQHITALVEQLLWLLDSAVDAATGLAAAAGN
jgi:hypothetical protein